MFVYYGLTERRLCKKRIMPDTVQTNAVICDDELEVCQCLICVSVQRTYWVQRMSNPLSVTHFPSGVATGWTNVDVSTPLLPEIVPEVSANPVKNFYGGQGRVGKGSARLELHSPLCKIRSTRPICRFRSAAKAERVSASRGLRPPDPLNSALYRLALRIGDVRPPQLFWPGDAPVNLLLFCKQHQKLRKKEKNYVKITHEYTCRPRMAAITRRMKWVPPIWCINSSCNVKQIGLPALSPVNAQTINDWSWIITSSRTPST